YNMIVLTDNLHASATHAFYIKRCTAFETIMDKKIIDKYFNIVLLSDKDDSFFDVYDILIPKYIKTDTNENRKYLLDLKSGIIDFGVKEGYFNQFNSGHCELTDKGKLAKKKGGHKKYLKSEKKYWMTKYQAISLFFVVFFGIIAIYQRCNNNSYKSDSDSVNPEYNHADSLSVSHQEKTKEQQEKKLNDSLKTKSLSD
ncbi:hypothetical protein, partial [Pseudofulvibacter geojedonensis]